MFSTYTFSEVPFCFSEVIQYDFAKGGNPGARPRKNQYEIYGRIFYLTAREYAEYRRAQLDFKKQIKKPVEELVEIIIDNKPKYKHLRELLVKPIFEVNRLEIPLLPDLSLANAIEEKAFQRLLDVRRTIEQIEFDNRVKKSEIIRKKKREQDDLLALLLLI